MGEHHAGHASGARRCPAAGDALSTRWTTLIMDGWQIVVYHVGYASGACKRPVAKGRIDPMAIRVAINSCSTYKQGARMSCSGGQVLAL
eukprot:1158841-Pelagomonas_calceolata.AAC.3